MLALGVSGGAKENSLVIVKLAERGICNTKREPEGATMIRNKRKQLSLYVNLVCDLCMVFCVFTCARM